jgi:hypothetical protein
VPDVGGVTVGSNLANSVSAETGPNDLIIPNIGDSLETTIGILTTDPSESVNEVIAPAVSSAVSSAVIFVFQTIGGFLTSFVTGAISAVSGSTGTHLIGLVVALVVVAVMFH